jgi:hypothetical protein
MARLLCCGTVLAVCGTVQAEVAPAAAAPAYGSSDLPDSMTGAPFTVYDGTGKPSQSKIVGIMSNADARTEVRPPPAAPGTLMMSGSAAPGS